VLKLTTLVARAPLPRAAAIALGVFGVLAMVLAATGFFALTSYSAVRRIREIGIRMAFGLAAYTNALILAHAHRAAFPLLACHLGQSSRWAAAIRSIVWHRPARPIAYVVIALLTVVAIAMLACWIADTRAVRIDPARALRE
jgi:putative ABC transport system permease protein